MTESLNLPLNAPLAVELPTGMLELTVHASSYPLDDLLGFADGFDQVAVPPVRNGIRVAELTSPTELV